MYTNEVEKAVVLTGRDVSSESNRGAHRLRRVVHDVRAASHGIDRNVRKAFLH
jgi:hypothetical protein